MRITEKKEDPKEGTEALHSQSLSSLGPSCRFDGDLQSNENLMIAGHVQGKIQIGENDLVILKSARIQADIKVKNVTVKGQVIGNIQATGKVLIEDTAKMTGDITAPCLSIMDGAKFKGSVHMTKDNLPVSRTHK